MGHIDHKSRPLLYFRDADADLAGSGVSAKRDPVATKFYHFRVLPAEPKVDKAS